MSRIRILFGEMLPNILGPMMVETTLRLTYSIAVISALAFLGLAAKPGRTQLGHDDPEEPRCAGHGAVGRPAADPGHRAAHHGHRSDR